VNNKNTFLKIVGKNNTYSYRHLANCNVTLCNFLADKAKHFQQHHFVLIHIWHWYVFAQPLNSRWKAER